MHMTTVCMHMTTMRALLLHFWAREDTGPAVSDFVTLAADSDFVCDSCRVDCRV